MYSVSQAKHNALKKENERLKELLSEDLVAENAKLKARIDELESENNVMALHIEDMDKEADEHRINYLTLFGELQTHLESIPKIKAEAIRDAVEHFMVNTQAFTVPNMEYELNQYADQLE